MARACRQSRLAASGRVIAVPLNRRRLFCRRRCRRLRPRRPGPAPPTPGLLFRLSADKGLTADFAAGDPVPNFADKATIVPRAPGAARSPPPTTWCWPGRRRATSTPSAARSRFFWRSRYPVGEAPFPIFRVGFADHSSWDMAWLRIDWNGHGFDAFVTDNNLARTRVSFKLPKAPAPDAWTHLAFTWDETSGVELYVDGKLAAKQAASRRSATPASTSSAPPAAWSPRTRCRAATTSMRGGDYDELRIYDHALAAGQVAALAKAEEPPPGAPAATSPPDPRTSGPALRLEPPGRRPAAADRPGHPHPQGRVRRCPATSRNGCGRPPTASPRPPGPASTTARACPAATTTSSSPTGTSTSRAARR